MIYYFRAIIILKWKIMNKILLLSFLITIIITSCKKEENTPVNYKISDISTEAPQGIISWDDIEAAYTGKFTVPSGSEGVKDQNFHYSFGAFCMPDNNSIIIEGHDYCREARKVILPSVLDGSEGTVEGNWFDPTDGLLSSGMAEAGGYRLGDMLNIGDRIYFTKHVWYNAGGTDHDSFGYLQKGFSFDDGTAYGMWNADHELANNMRIGGYFCHPPENLTAEGVTFLAGQEGLSGSAMGRWGPNLFAVKFDDTKSVGEAMNVIPLVSHSSEENAPEYWWIANRVYSVAWIEVADKHGLLMLFTRGYGDTWYGEADDNNPPDPYGGGKGYHSSGKQLVAWVYDPVDLMKVYNGEIEPHEIRPVYEKVLIDLKPGEEKGEETYYSFLENIRGTRMDMYGNRLIILQRSYGDLPVGYVVDL